MANFSLDMSKFAGKSQKAIDGAIRKTILDLTTSIILDTPVDTGRARANWSVSFEVPDTSEKDDTNWKLQLTDNKAKLNTHPIGRYIYIQNNLPYIATLEYGLYPKNPKFGTKYEIRDSDKFVTETGYVQLSSGGFSKQSPNGFLRKNLLRYSKI